MMPMKLSHHIEDSHRYVPPIIMYMGSLAIAGISRA